MSNPFDRNPFRLPPPWNAGYALPQNVDDEGLERRTYTTAWAPRGSFDDPKVGDAGYAVPQYVKDEGYGVGAMVTRWAQRGTYAGPKVRHWLDSPPPKMIGAKPLPGGGAQVQLATLSGVEVANTGQARFTAYGMKSARAVLETVKMMPPDLRVKQLKKALDKIDPKLYSRAEELANLEKKTGVSDEDALERGLAAAMSVGMATEVVDLGKGKAPPKKSQLGAVCYGCAMLGAAELQKTALMKTALAPQLMAIATSGGPGSYAPRDGFCWMPATSTVPGHWERLRAGQTSCANQPPDGASVTVRTHNGGSPGGGVSVTGPDGKPVAGTPPPRPTQDHSDVHTDQKFLNIGPFLIPTNVGAYSDHRALTAEKKAYVDENVAIAAKAGGISIKEMKTGKYPFVRFKANGEDWGLFYQENDGTQVTSRGTKIPAGTVVAYHKIAPSMMGNIIGDIGGAIKDAAEWVGGAIASVFKKIWAGIKWVAAKVVDFVEDVAEFVKDAACKLFTSPVGQLAGAAAGAYVGGPAGAQAGAAGAQVVAQACTPTPEPTPQQPPAAAPSSSMLPILLIGGAGLAAVLLLGGKKH